MCIADFDHIDNVLMGNMRKMEVVGAGKGVEGSAGVVLVSGMGMLPAVHDIDGGLAVAAVDNLYCLN